MQIPAIRLKTGKEKSLLRRHPWVFAGAISNVYGDPGCGETVKILSSDGDFLAWGAYSPNSQIRVRIWSWDNNDEISRLFLKDRIQKAISLREIFLSDPQTSAVRLVFGEADGLPGFIVDRYGTTLVIQILSCGAEFWRNDLISLLSELTGLGCIYERSDVDVRSLEHLPEKKGILRGVEIAGKIQINEHGLKFIVDIEDGHKTGFYLDQRDNRLHVRKLAQGRDVLDCFAYTGGFTVNALLGGAKSITAVDSSASALGMGREHCSLNQLPTANCEWIHGDVFQILRNFRDRRIEFDMIILDPPKFAPTTAQAERAARAYKDINLLAFKLLRSGGILVTFSCSGGVSAELFQKIIAGAALDAGAQAQIIGRLSQAADHPVALNFPESEYLKGLIAIKR